MLKIPVCTPFIGDEEKENVLKCFDEKEISGSFGNFIEKFEISFSRYCGVKYGVSTNSGTTALHLALVAAGINKGDEVIIPTFTNIATALAVIYTDAIPVLVDSEPGTWNIDSSKIEQNITKKTKAIMVVHIYGHPVDMDEVLEIAKKYNLLVFEDAAEAHGATYKGNKVGSLSDVACFSFYANKNITTGEGGMILTNSEEISTKARLLKNLAFENSKISDKGFEHNYIGFNYRMTNLQAAIGLAQVEKLDLIVAKKRKIATFYNSFFNNIEGITLPIEQNWAKNVYWMYGILIEENFPLTREQLRNQLFRNGIETRTFFTGMHHQPAFSNYNFYQSKLYPVSDSIEKKGLYLPSAPSLTKQELKYVVNSISNILKIELHKNKGNYKLL
jgi:perosamine synthetase